MFKDFDAASRRIIALGTVAIVSAVLIVWFFFKHERFSLFIGLICGALLIAVGLARISHPM
jgi:hypothetical protein